MSGSEETIVSELKAQLELAEAGKISSISMVVMYTDHTNMNAVYFDDNDTILLVRALNDLSSSIITSALQRAQDDSTRH